MNAMANPTVDEDRLAVIWILLTLKWSWRRIARVQLPKSHHTVKALYEKACNGNELNISAKLPAFAKSDRKVRTVPVGSTADLDYIEAENNNRRKGKRIRPRTHNSGLMGNSHEEQTQNQEE